MGLRSGPAFVIEATLYTDAGCPWAYSANPSLRVLEWRYRDQLSWRLVMIGLREEPSDAMVRTYDPDRVLVRYRWFAERYGMPFSRTAKKRASGTGPGCRAVVAAGMLQPGRDWAVLRALQVANFTSDLYLDDPESIRAALTTVDGIDADAVVARIDDDEVLAEYERQRAEARSAEGTPAHAQEKTAMSDGLVRFTAPSVVFRDGERSFVAGGWQPLLAYDVVLANLDPTLARVPLPESPDPLLDFFPHGLTTAEVALLLADGPDPTPNGRVAEATLSALVAKGKAVRIPVGTDALWARVHESITPPTNSTVIA